MNTAKPMLFFLLALTAGVSCPAMAQSDWSWVALDSQGTGWGISQGKAIVDIGDTTVEARLLWADGKVECKMTGRIERNARLDSFKVQMRSIRAKILCYGTERDASWFEGMLSVLPLAKSGARKVIRVDDGFNVFALTSDSYRHK